MPPGGNTLMNVHATSRHLTVDSLGSHTASIDVCFDGARVWSIDVRDEDAAHAPHVFAWPEALLPLLTGRSRVSIHDSATSVELGAVEARFSGATHRTRVADGAGAPLVVNKWGRLGVALETMGAETQRLIVARSAELVEWLDARGLRPFVVGGTLLGAVRSGTLLPHDDDADIAYLSAHTAPVDVAVEAFRLGRELVAAGYEIQRHSATHMQLLFRDDAGALLHYIDVFAAFFSADGQINQPFHVRGEMQAAQLLPFQSVTIGDTEFPAPADTNHWLTINYDENWRTPIPGYVLETPVSTRRRFENWFGAFNLHREFWNEHYDPQRTGAATDADWETGAAWLLAETAGGRGDWLVDVGCGAGALTHRLTEARPNRHVLGLDFSEVALERAREATASSPQQRSAKIQFGHANMYRLSSLTSLQDAGVSGPFDAVANHLFEQLGHLGREQGWRLLRMAIRSGGEARFTFHAHHAHNVQFEDPTGWHLSELELSQEAARWGLAVQFVPLCPHHAPCDTHCRRPTGAMVTQRTPTPHSAPTPIAPHGRPE